jgi:2-dehydro-3-deoxy-D-arabinonate dehydratase
MKLCQFFLPGKGRRVGVVEGDSVLDVTAPRTGAPSVLALVERARSAEALDRAVRELARSARSRFAWKDLDRAPSPRRPHLLAPIDPPEVWGAGITYQRSREYYEAHTGAGGRTKGIYDYVYEAKRPELFFKATASRTVGPNGAIGIRKDSVLTAVEPELSVVIGAGGRIVAYSASNDLSAWDIERENPLYLPQSKMFDSCFALGPVLATAREVGDPHALELSCRIVRAGAAVFEGHVNTGQLKRRCDELADWLQRSNRVPAGTVISTGTGILVPDEHALRAGDVVEITLDKVGTLRNPVKRLA